MGARKGVSHIDAFIPGPKPGIFCIVILAAGFEMIFEKYELESLLGQGENIWQAVWRQGLSEAVGEGTTEAANILADVAVMAERSDWQQNIRRYLAENPDWDYKQAAKQAFIDAALRVSDASFGGWISGSTMGGGYSVIQNIAANIQNNQQAYDLYGEFQQELVREALELDPNNAYAQKLQGKLDSNKQLSGAQLGKLAAQNDAVIRNQDTQNALTDQNNTVDKNTDTGNIGQLNATVQAANNQAKDSVGQSNASTQAATDQTNTSINQADVAKSLKGKGIPTQKTDSLAGAIVARLNGQELTRTQRKLLSVELGSPTVQSVISKLIKKKADGIDSAQNRMYDEGNFSSLKNGEETALRDSSSLEVLPAAQQRGVTYEIAALGDTSVAEASPIHQERNALPKRRSRGGKDVKKPYATSRPGYGKGQVEQVWENAKDPITGKVFDPSGVEITWDPTKPRNGQWDMGHIPEAKYSKMHQLYMDDVISLEKFLEWYRNPANYRPELPSTNRSHKYE